MNMETKRDKIIHIMIIHLEKKIWNILSVF